MLLLPFRSAASEFFNSFTRIDSLSNCFISLETLDFERVLLEDKTETEFLTISVSTDNFLGELFMLLSFMFLL
jgi:hypothetical protein